MASTNIIKGPPADSTVVDTPESDGTGPNNVDIDLQKEVWDSTAVDPVLAKKMALINDGIDEIGMTPWQWKLFFLNGFGYAVDSVSSCYTVEMRVLLSDEQGSYLSCANPSPSQQSPRSSATQASTSRASRWHHKLASWLVPPFGASLRISSAASWRLTQVSSSAPFLC
jgi:hypothetical protein